MRAILILLALTTTANAADYHLQKAARMIANKTLCAIDYDPEDLRQELIKGSLGDGVAVAAGGQTAVNIAVAIMSRVNGSVGAPAYCETQ